MQIKSAVTKYKGFRTIVSKPELEKIVAADDKQYSPEDVAEILAALEAEPATPSVDAALKGVENSKLKWYDEFQAVIQKRLVRNPLKGTQESIITGWELGKKLMPKLIEPGVAKHLNSFADGFAEQPGLLLVPKDERKNGDTIPYKEWADIMERNPKEDINQLLND